MPIVEVEVVQEVAVEGVILVSIMEGEEVLLPWAVLTVVAVAIVAVV